MARLNAPAAVILFATSVLTLPSCTAPPVPDVEAVLIHKTGYLCGDQAVLITDRKQILELSRLVLTNKTAGHACEFHWLIRFVMPDGTIITRAHNIECEEYLRSNARTHAVLGRYFDQVLKSPTAFITNLTVRSAESPADLSAALVGVGRVLQFEGADERLPRIVIRATAASPIPEDRSKWDAATAANQAAANEILAKAVVVMTQKQAAPSLGPIQFAGSEFGGGQIVHHVERTVFLPIGSSVASLPPLPVGAAVAESRVPESYVAQLITSQQLDGTALEALARRHSFLLLAAPFDEGCVPIR